MEQPEYLYHYTTMSALFGMLNNLDEKNDDSIRFWASHISYMNDPAEYNFFISALSNAVFRYEKLHGLSKRYFRLKQAYDTIGALAGDFYILSLSENQDNLSMWRAYGSNGQGVAIGFKTKDLKSIDIQKENECDLKKIEYFDYEELIGQFDKMEIEKIYKELGKAKMEIDKAILEKRIVYKDISYADEREWRIIKQCTECNFREKSGLIVPYTEINIPMGAIDHIYIGPCANDQLSRLSLSKMLGKIMREKDIKFDISIKNSTIQYVIR